MKWMLRSTLVVATALTCGVGAQAQYNAPPVQSSRQPAPAPQITTDQALLHPQVPEFRIVANDVLTITVFGQGTLGDHIRVDSDGNVALPFLGNVHLAGLSLTEAQLMLAQKLVQAGIYTAPEVTITPVEGPNVAATLVGEARATIPVYGSKGLLEVLNAAGGLPATASHIVTINRPGLAAPIVVDLGTDPATSLNANIPILPGDVVVTGKVGVAYAIGAFKTQTVIQLNGNSPLTLMQATAYCGGPTFDAKYSDLRLVRTINGQRTVVKMDIEKVLLGKAPDPILEPNDILYLPTSAWKASITNGTSGMAFGLLSLAFSMINLVRY